MKFDFFIQDVIIFLEWTSYIILIFIVTKVDNWSMTYFSDGQIGSWRVYDVLVMDESVKKESNYWSCQTSLLRSVEILSGKIWNMCFVSVTNNWILLWHLGPIVTAFLFYIVILLCIRCYSIEKRVKTSDKYLFPSYETINWYAAKHILDTMRGKINLLWTHQ